LRVALPDLLRRRGDRSPAGALRRSPGHRVRRRHDPLCGRRGDLLADSRLRGGLALRPPAIWIPHALPPPGQRARAVGRPPRRGATLPDDSLPAPLLAHPPATALRVVRRRRLSVPPLRKGRHGGGLPLPAARARLLDEGALQAPPRRLDQSRKEP